MRWLVIPLFVLTSGCSGLFGDTFRDRSEGYLAASEGKPLVDEKGRLVPVQDAYPIPALTQAVTSPSAFRLPMPERLVAGQAVENQVATLSQYQSEELNPRLSMDGSGSEILLLDSGFANAWAIVTETLSTMDYKLTDLNRSIGAYYLDIERPGTKEDLGWWSRLWGAKPEPVITSYLLKMNRTGTGVYLSLQTDVDALADKAIAHQVLSDLADQLAQ